MSNYENRNRNYDLPIISYVVGGIGGIMFIVVQEKWLKIGSLVLLIAAFLIAKYGDNRDQVKNLWSVSSAQELWENESSAFIFLLAILASRLQFNVVVAILLVISYVLHIWSVWDDWKDDIFGKNNWITYVLMVGSILLMGVAAWGKGQESLIKVVRLSSLIMSTHAWVYLHRVYKKNIRDDK